jgi:hypothetical protein
MPSSSKIQPFAKSQLKLILYWTICALFLQGIVGHGTERPQMDVVKYSVQKATPQSWVLLPGKGISQGSVKILLGQKRTDLRLRLVPLFGVQKSNFPSEDDYADGTLRLTFNSSGLLNRIEILGGQLQHNGLEFFATRFSKLQAALKKRYGYAPTWNNMLDQAELPELGITYASQEHVGGDVGYDAMAWVGIEAIATNVKKPSFKR